MGSSFVFSKAHYANSQHAIKLHTQQGTIKICDKPHVYNYEGGGVSFFLKQVSFSS